MEAFKQGFTVGIGFCAPQVVIELGQKVRPRIMPIEPGSGRWV